MLKDIVVREEYQKNGETKTSWNKIGILIDNGDKSYVKLFHMPGVLCSVFEQKERKQGKPQDREIDLDSERTPF